MSIQTAAEELVQNGDRLERHIFICHRLDELSERKDKLSHEELQEGIKLHDEYLLNKDDEVDEIQNHITHQKKCIEIYVRLDELDRQTLLSNEEKEEHQNLLDEYELINKHFIW